MWAFQRSLFRLNRTCISRNNSADRLKLLKVGQPSQQQPSALLTLGSSLYPRLTADLCTKERRGIIAKAIALLIEIILSLTALLRLRMGTLPTGSENYNLINGSHWIPFDNIEAIPHELAPFFTRCLESWTISKGMVIVPRYSTELAKHLIWRKYFGSWTCSSCRSHFGGRDSDIRHGRTAD
jgi:hypothetical protein